jgi:hypothetical protein
MRKGKNKSVRMECQKTIPEFNLILNSSWMKFWPVPVVLKEAYFTRKFATFPTILLTVSNITIQVMALAESLFSSFSVNL